MTIYEPVTDIGKAIAKALTKDDGIRLDVHDILEKWEPEYITEKEKAEKYDATNWNAIRSTLDEKIEAEQKLDAVENWFIEYADTKIEKFDHPWRKLEKILEAEG